VVTAALLRAQTLVWAQIKTADIKKIFLRTLLFISVSFRQFRCIDAANIQR
jgi:hypothetical protein